MTIMDIATQVIQNRRSVYPPQFTGEIIPDAIIVQMLENAQHAPTHKLTQPWRFTVFAGDAKQTFANAWAEAYKICAEENNAFSQSTYDKMLTKPMACSHIIAIGMKRHEIIPEFEEICSVACAVQNMLLTASAAGAGGYWSTGGADTFHLLKLFFNLEDRDKLLGFLFLGMPRKMDFPPRQREPIEKQYKWYK